MNMNARTGFGVIGLVLAIAACFTADAALWLALAAMAAAIAAAVLRAHLLALAIVVVVLLKTFFIDPTVWASMAGTERAGADRSVAVFRILLLGLIAIPVITMAVNHIYSKLTDRLIAVLAMALLASFLGVIVWKVTQGPLITVFAVAVIMAAYDFSRELRERAGAPDDRDS